MSRKLLLVLSTGALAAAGLFTSGAAKASTAASSTPSGGACQLTGNANFTPGLTGTSGSFTYGFTGKLTSCQSSDSSVTSGSVEAGQVLTVGTSTYQEPIPTGTGSCANGTTQGTAIVTWNNGKHTVETYTTTSAGALVVLQGSVSPGITLSSTNGGSPLTINSDESAMPPGSTALGQLTFSTASPTGITACNTAAGLTSAVINGLIEAGQA